jgi:hypothetical protein
MGSFVIGYYKRKEDCLADKDWYEEKWPAFIYQTTELTWTNGGKYGARK